MHTYLLVLHLIIRPWMAIVFLLIKMWKHELKRDRKRIRAKWISNERSRNVIIELELDSSRVGYDSKGLNINELNEEIFWHRKKTDNPNIFIMVSWKKGNIDVKGGRVEDTAYKRKIKELRFKKKKKKKKVETLERGKNKQWKGGMNFRRVYQDSRGISTIR